MTETLIKRPRHLKENDSLARMGSTALDGVITQPSGAVVVR